MSRPLLRHLVLLVVLGLGIIAFYWATSGTGTISQRIGDAARTSGARQVDLAKLTSFGWDRFYYFKPGTSRDEICSFIGAKPGRCKFLIRYECVPDDSNALLFSLNGQLTHMELHALANGSFDFAAGRTGFARTAAVFRIRRSMSGNQERIVLEPL